MSRRHHEWKCLHLVNNVLWKPFKFDQSLMKRISEEYCVIQISLKSVPKSPIHNQPSFLGQRIDVEQATSHYLNPCSPCIDGLVQGRRNSSALAKELHLSCITLSTYWRIYASHGLNLLTDLFLYYKSRYNMNFFNMVADGSEEVEAMQKFLEENLKLAREGGYKVRGSWPREHATSG